MAEYRIPTKGLIIWFVASSFIIMASVLTMYIVIEGKPELIYVFQLGRHGARSPENEILPQNNKFNVGPGQLTA